MNNYPFNPSKLFLVFIWMLLFGTVSENITSAQDRGMTPEDVSEYQIVGGAEISADARQIAYTLVIQADPNVDNDFASQHLYILDTETEESRPYYTSSTVSSVSFRPDHSSVTFLTRLEDETENALYEIPLDGGDAQEIFRFETSISDYKWTSDGSRIAFTANEPVEEEESSLPYEPEVFEEDFVHQRGYIVGFNNENAGPMRIQAQGTVYAMSWSPDDRNIAISETPTPTIDDFYMSQQVKIVNAESGQITSEIDNEGKLGQIEWSPDGSQLALRAGHDINDPIDGRIMVVSSEGGTPENILPDFEGKFEQIKWTQNNTIRFLASEGTETSFGTISPDGTRLNRELSADGPNFISFSKANDDTFAFVGGTMEHPTEVYLREGKQQPTRVTHSNEWLDQISLGEQRTIRYPARDGLEIEGILILPVDYQEDNSYPLIVMVHGGPEAHYSNGWLTAYSMPGQVGAAEGYAVFYPNYRGSTGRGLEFVKTSQGDAAGAEFDDIVDGVDYLIEEGIADPDRVGVTGGSYGGYATAWMSTYYSDRFAAGVMNVGISNFISKWGTSDIPQELYLVHSLDWLWDDNNWQKYLKRSPIYHVDNAQTALLIAHGAEDTRVHPGQSLELHRHIKVRKPEVPLRLVLYPGEGHGYSRATARYDYNLRMMRWFERYLKEDSDEVPDATLKPED
ncbi:MAG: S9 family peptidase [Balneolales bacterium]